MKKKIKIIIVSFMCIAGVVFFWYIFGTIEIRHAIKSIKENQVRSLPLIVSCLKEYIKENKGLFPSSEDDLINKGFIIKKSARVYSIRISDSNSVGNDEWKEIWNFYHFDIYYGVDINDIIVKENKLYNRKSSQQIFLINGRFDRPLFEKASYDLYKGMLKYKN